jgi:hypothetical protein
MGVISALGDFRPNAARPFDMPRRIVTLV